MGQRLVTCTVFLPMDVVERLEAYAQRNDESSAQIAADAITNRLKLLEFVETLHLRIGRRKAEQGEG